MIILEYTYRCDLCDNNRIETHNQIGGGYAKPEPCVPVGWMQIAGRIICDKHDIQELTVAEALGLKMVAHGDIS
jgi:hypothetical protein